MTDTTISSIAEARKALATAGAALDTAEARIGELQAAITQSANAALAVANGRSVEAIGSTSAGANVKPKPAERKPRQRQRQPRGEANRKTSEAIASMAGLWTTRDLAKKAKVEDRDVYRPLRKAEAEGRVRVAKKEGSTRYYETVITPAAETNGSGDEAQVPALA